MTGIGNATFGLIGSGPCRAVDARAPRPAAA